MIRDAAPAQLEQAISLGTLPVVRADTGVWADYSAQLRAATTKRHRYELNLFKKFLISKGMTSPGDLHRDPEAWIQIQWGSVVSFQRWLVSQGYTLSSVNQRVNTIKLYARLSCRAGLMDLAQYALIQAIEPYTIEDKALREKGLSLRGETGRVGAKKTGPTELQKNQVQALKKWADTPVGRRDTLLMCLFLDQGLWPAEVVGLQFADLDLEAGQMRISQAWLRAGGQTVQKMTDDTRSSATSYLRLDADREGPLLKGSRRGGKLQGTFGLRAINNRVRKLGEHVGVESLAPSDCRLVAIEQTGA